MLIRCLSLLLVVLLAGCGGAPGSAPAERTAAERPWILLVTLDTTRADAIGPDAAGVSTPAFNALVARGQRFRHAYATVPETLPSHLSMMTGLYPAGHGIHENGRAFGDAHEVLAEKLKTAGYRTGAFVSSFVLAQRFGIGRGFDVYDDELPAGGVERSSKATTDRAIAHVSAATGPQFVWVHYFDPHTPYAPPEPFKSRHIGNPYLGEIEAMDAELGRLVTAFEEAAARNGSRAAIIAAGDHGEGLGDHGEQHHGNLVYQSTMQVPLVVAAPGVSPSTSDVPVSIRRVYHTVLDLAGLGSDGSLRGSPTEPVLGEAMKPFLNYGWQPQIMAIQGTQKAIFAGTLETYDLAADPGELKNLGAGTSLPAEMRKALDDYPIPSLGGDPTPEGLSEEARRNLASLGYVSGTATPVVRKDAPRPADMTSLFPVMDEASNLFVQGRHREVIPLLQKILAADSHNLDAALRLASSYSSLGQNGPALEAFRQAASIAPKSDDVRLYLALHYTRTNDWEQAVPILERIVAEQPQRVAALEGLATVREKQERLAEAVQLRQKVYGLRPPSAAELIALGGLAMEAGRTPEAIAAFERARALQGPAFQNHIELGVLYLDERRFAEARDALDKVPASSRDYPMALFKRAQVSVLLKEPDAGERIRRARERATPLTRELIAREKLFAGK